MAPIQFTVLLSAYFDLQLPGKVRQTIFGKLHFASLALEMLAQILALKTGQTFSSSQMTNRQQKWL